MTAQKRTFLAFCLYTGFRSKWKFRDGLRDGISGIGSFATSGALANDNRLARMMLTIIALQSLQMFIIGPCKDFSL